MLNTATPAPNLEIFTHTGYKGPLSFFWGHGPLVLFFYPWDETAICTKEACTLQSALGEFGTFGAQTLGSSTNGLKSHKSFAEKNKLTFPLVVDEGGKLAKAYDAYRSMLVTGVSKRVTYVIGKDGVILGGIHDETNVQNHIEFIRKTLKG